MEDQDHKTFVEQMAEYEVMVSHSTLWERTIIARSQEHAEEIAEKQWQEGEFTKPDPDTGATSPVGWDESNDSGTFEIV